MSDRIALDDLTSDQLDQLYADLDRYEEVVGEVNEANTGLVRRAARAEDALSRTRRMAEQWRERAGENPATAQAWTSAANAVLTSTSTEHRPAEPTPVRESYRIRVLETRVSDAEYERDLARQRAGRAEAALEQVRALRERARTEAPASQGPTWEGLALALDGNLPAPAATEATSAPTTEQDARELAAEYETNARVLSALHQTADATVTRVIELYEQWVKAGPPPLGVPLARWWDKRLAELHDAIQPADQTTEK
ncbi:hypothetical protein [Streptomyces parvulus]|uniref:hypothetical protein n=1 Tax=Streptomyces parvulus TaxID=146923 RepID=UPI0036D11700